MSAAKPISSSSSISILPEAHEVLSVGRDAIHIFQTSDEALCIDQLETRIFRSISACEEDHVEILALIDDFQQRIAAAVKTLKEEQERGGRDGQLEALRSKLEAAIQTEKLLQQEGRSIDDHLEALREQRQSLQTQKEALKRAETEIFRNQHVLTLCASVTHIIPHLPETGRVSGTLVDGKGHVVNSFDMNFEETSEFEICDKLWRMGEM